MAVVGEIYSAGVFAVQLGLRNIRKDDFTMRLPHRMCINDFTTSSICDSDHVIGWF